MNTQSLVSDSIDGDNHRFGVYMIVFFSVTFVLHSLTRSLPLTLTLTHTLSLCPFFLWTRKRWVATGQFSVKYERIWLLGNRDQRVRNTCTLLLDSERVCHKYEPSQIQSDAALWRLKAVMVCTIVLQRGDGNGAKASSRYGFMQFEWKTFNYVKCLMFWSGSFVSVRTCVFFRSFVRLFFFDHFFVLFFFVWPSQALRRIDIPRYVLCLFEQRWYETGVRYHLPFYFNLNRWTEFKIVSLLSFK